MFTLFQSYEKDALACSEHVWLEVPVLCARMEAHLEDLHNKHQGDAELLRCIPFPESDHAEHPLVTNMVRMREGARDFDVFCTLWSRSGYEKTHGPKKRKDSRVFQLPRNSNFDISFFQRLVQDAYGKVTTAMHEVIAERKRAEAEAAKLAKIEELKQTAIAAAKKKLEEDKQLAEASVIATVACEHIAMSGDANREATDEDNAAAKKAVSNFCSCSSSFFFSFFSLCFFSL